MCQVTSAHSDEKMSPNLTSKSQPSSLPPPAAATVPSPSLLRLAVCASGICVSYCLYGLLQESLFTGVHLGPTFCLVTACLTNVFVARTWEWVEMHLMFRLTKLKHDQRVKQRKQNDDSARHDENLQQLLKSPPPSDRLPHKLLLSTAFCYIVAMTCSNEAIPHVSYPVAVLAKSCKLIPTMLVGQFLERKSYNRSEWMAALCISCGIVLFHATRLGKSNDLHHAENNQQRRNFGMLLLMISLLSDGLLGSCQNLIKLCSVRDANLLPPTAVQTMYYVNLYALVFLVPLSIYNGQLRLATLQRIFVNEPVLSWNLLLLNASAGIGQVFIFLTITWYSPVVCTTITTTRKFVTILLSVYAFGHSFSMLQWVSMVLVFGGLYTVVWVQHDKQMQQQQQQHIGPLQKERIVGGDDEISQSVAIKAKVD